MESRFQPGDGEIVRRDCGLFHCELRTLTYYRLSRLFTDLGFSHRAITFLELIRRTLSLRQGISIYFFRHLYTVIRFNPFLSHSFISLGKFPSFSRSLALSLPLFSLFIELSSALTEVLFLTAFRYSYLGSSEKGNTERKMIVRKSYLALIIYRIN